MRALECVLQLVASPYRRRTERARQTIPLFTDGLYSAISNAFGNVSKIGYLFCATVYAYIVEKCT